MSDLPVLPDERDSSSWLDLEFTRILDENLLRETGSFISDLAECLGVSSALDSTGQTIEPTADFTKEAKKRPKRRRTEREHERRFNRTLGKWLRPPLPARSQFKQNTIYETYASFLHDVKTRPTTLPDEVSSTTALIAFPEKYKSPMQVPKDVRKTMSEYRFLYNHRHTIYRPALGHMLYTVSRSSAEEGKTLADLCENGGRREVFHRSGTTGSIHYLGLFQLVASVAFPYSYRGLCGGFPEISQISPPPVRRNIPPPRFFYVLQFQSYNRKILEAFSAVEVPCGV